MFANAKHCAKSCLILFDFFLEFVCCFMKHNFLWALHKCSLKINIFQNLEPAQWRASINNNKKLWFNKIYCVRKMAMCAVTNTVCRFWVSLSRITSVFFKGTFYMLYRISVLKLDRRGPWECSIYTKNILWLLKSERRWYNLNHTFWLYKSRLNSPCKIWTTLLTSPLTVRLDVEAPTTHQ